MPGSHRLPFLLLVMAATSCSPSPTASDRIAAEIDAIVAEAPDAVVAVSVRDAGTGTRFDRLPERDFHAASTMKVPVLIELFRQVATGRRSLDDSVRVENRFRSIVDGSEFSISDDSYDDLYGRIGTLVAVRDLAETMITWSSNLATNLLIQEVTADSVQATSRRLGAARLQTLRGVEDLKAFEAGLSNRTNAPDLATLFEALRDGRAVSAEADREMVAILLRQEFNSMIPAGLPEGTRVAHKTGSITRIHHDAGIVYPADGEPYVLVILTEGIDDIEASGRLGARIAAAVHAALRP